MHATIRKIGDDIVFLARFFFLLCIGTLEIHGQEGGGCGHTVLGTESGTLASRNFPGTYPNSTRCKWRLQVPQGRTLQLAFGDFDLEASPGCRDGSLTILRGDGTPHLGPLCGHINATWRRTSLNSSKATVLFISGTHRSGRGFLLSYATDLQPDLISCMERGTHYGSPQFSAFCPAGCRDVTGDIWGQSSQGYRDTSVLCKAAVHAGVVSDVLGGSITVTRERSITLYESSFANSVLSKTGSLSEKKLVFHRDCARPLTVSSFNASSVLEEVDDMGHRMLWLPGNRDSLGRDLPWAATSDDPKPWLELSLQNKVNITGIITKGVSSRSSSFYVKSYTLLYSKDRKNWRTYRAALSKEKKVFVGNWGSSQEVLNSLIPPVLAQYILLQPQEWHVRAATHIQVLGCRPTPAQPRMVNNTPKIVAPTETTVKNPGLGSPEIKDIDQGSGHTVWLAVGIPLALVLSMCCLWAVLHWKRRKSAVHLKRSLAQESHVSQGKNAALSDEVQYPLQRGIHDPLPLPPFNDYAEPDLLMTGPKLDSTFRPAANEGYTVPLVPGHYDVPGRGADYAEPLPSEPEYAMPFGDQPVDSLASHTQPKRNLCVVRVVPQAPRTDAMWPNQYDCPSHRGLPNSYCATPTHAYRPSTDSVLYAEPQSANSLLQHTYQEPM